MRLADARTGFLIASTFLIGLARPALPATLTSEIDFKTDGTIDSTGVTGPSIVHFEGTDSSLTTGSSFELGRFVIDPLPNGSQTTYDHTPFELTFTPRSVDGVAVPDATPVVLRGLISGTIDGGGTSNAHYWIDRLTYPLEETPPFPSYVDPFPAGNLTASIFDAPGASTRLPSSTEGGSMALRAVIQAVPSPEPVPEPGPMALFACVAGLAALRRFRR
ncbi:PEP-CTERM sorting domain-containing protein [Tundrisphaera lichenicola]|uniref:PEP-CTERM sorting domain-containing protein n=1 Tax=Tundrisphaera lichenicola TaxID=2029860 RepID=UPI003EBC5CB7